MSDTFELVDPAECRRRAQQCRDQALRFPTVREDLSEAAATWEELARHADHLQEAYRRLKPPAA